MTPKVLARAGVSLADQYDVEGSIAGVEELLTRDVSLLHEMGATLFSERLTSEIISVATGNLAQDTDFDQDFTALLPTDVPCRILQLSVVVGTTNRLTRVAILARSNLSDSEIPLFIGDGTEDPVRMQLNGAAVGTAIMVGTDGAMPRRVPSMLTAGGARVTTVQSLFLRGRTSSFGAGTNQITALALIQFPRLEGVSSFGLPLPSW